MFNSSEKRLARLLLLLANFGKETQPEPIIAKISQETLAEMIGTTRSRVSFFMNKFRKLGLIDYNGGIEVHNSLLNVVLHDEPSRHKCAHFADGEFGAILYSIALAFGINTPHSGEPFPFSCLPLSNSSQQPTQKIGACDNTLLLSPHQDQVMVDDIISSMFRLRLHEPNNVA